MSTFFLYTWWCVFLWAMLYYCRGGGVLWLVSGHRARIREGVAESSSIYSVCGGGCQAGTYNSNTDSFSPDSQCAQFLFSCSPNIRSLLDASCILSIVCLCASVFEMLCYHNISEGVWQKIFDKPKISNLHFNESCLAVL